MKKFLKYLLMGVLMISTLNAEEQKAPKLNYNVGDSLWNLEFTDLKGNVKTLDSLKGKKVLLNFTATWCPDCQREKAEMNPDYEANYKGRDDVEFVIINGPYKNDTVETAQKYMEDNKYSYPLYFDYSRILTDEFGVKKIPTNILLDEDGKIMETAIEKSYKTMKYFQ